MKDEHVYDLLPGYALGTLDDRDLLTVARHLQNCAQCWEELSSYKRTVDRLAMACPQRTPPPRLRTEVIHRVAGSANQGKIARLAGQPTSSQTDMVLGTKGQGVVHWLNSLLFPKITWTIGSLGLILLIFLAINNLTLWQRVNTLQAEAPSGNARMVHLAGTQNAPQATGYLLVFSGDNYGTLTVEDAPALDTNHQYQIWLMKDGMETNGGVFSVSQNGYGVLEIAANQQLVNYQSFRITVEPKGGSPLPTGEKILEGSL